MTGIIQFARIGGGYCIPKKSLSRNIIAEIIRLMQLGMYLSIDSSNNYILSSFEVKDVEDFRDIEVVCKKFNVQPDYLSKIKYVYYFDTPLVQLIIEELFKRNQNLCFSFVNWGKWFVLKEKC